MDIEYLEEYKEIVLPLSCETNSSMNPIEKISPTAPEQEILSHINYQNCDGLIFGSGSSSTADKLQSSNNPYLKADTNSEAVDRKKPPCLVVRCSTNSSTLRTRNEYEEKYERLKKMFEPRKQENHKLTYDGFNQNNVEIGKETTLKERTTSIKTNDAKNDAIQTTETIKTNDSKTDSVETTVTTNSIDAKNDGIKTAVSGSSSNDSIDKIVSAVDIMFNENFKGKDSQDNETKLNQPITSQKVIEKEKIHSSIDLNHSHAQNNSKTTKKNLVGLVEGEKLDPKTSVPINNRSSLENNDQIPNEGKVVSDHKDAETKLQSLDQVENIKTSPKTAETVNGSQEKENSTNFNELIKKNKNSVPITIPDKKEFKPVKKALRLAKKRENKIKTSKRRSAKKKHQNIVRRLSNCSLQSLKAKKVPLISKSLRSKNLETDLSKNTLVNQTTCLFTRSKIKSVKAEMELKSPLTIIKKSSNSTSQGKVNEPINCNKMNSDADNKCEKTSLIGSKRTNKEVNRKEFLTLNSEVKKQGRPRKRKFNLNGVNVLSSDDKSELNQTTEVKKSVPNPAASTLSQPAKTARRLSNKMTDTDWIKKFNIQPAKVVLETLNLEKYLQKNRRGTKVKKIEAIPVSQSQNISIENDQKRSEKAVLKSFVKKKLVDEIGETVSNTDITPVTKAVGTPILTSKPKVFIVSPKKIETTNSDAMKSINTTPIMIAQEKLINSLQAVNKRFESREKAPLNSSKVLNTSNTSKELHTSEPIKIPEFIVVESKFVTRNEYHELLTCKNKPTTTQPSVHTQQPVRNVFLQMFELIDKERCQNISVKKTELRSKRTAFTKNINFSFTESPIEFANIVKSYLQNVRPTIKGNTKKNKNPAKKVNLKLNFKQNKIKKLSSKLQKEASTINSLNVDSRPSTSQYIKTHNPALNLFMHVVQNNCEEEPESILPDSFQINSDYIKEEDDEPKL